LEAGWEWCSDTEHRVVAESRREIHWTKEIPEEVVGVCYVKHGAQGRKKEKGTDDAAKTAC